MRLMSVRPSRGSADVRSRRCDDVALSVNYVPIVAPFPGGRVVWTGLATRSTLGASSRSGYAN